MAYDERLAERVREQLAPLRGVDEIKMFGGLCFTLNGNMTVGVLGSDLLVRFEPARTDEVLERPHAREMDFTTRPMKGFAQVAPTGLRDARALRRWLDLSLEYVGPMPPKVKKKMPVRTRGSRSGRGG